MLAAIIIIIIIIGSLRAGTIPHTFEPSDLSAAPCDDGLPRNVSGLICFCTQYIMRLRDMGWWMGAHSEG